MNHRLSHQGGGTLVGFIAGLIVGLGAALAVAVYVTRTPIPFLNKGNGRGADMDAAESRMNRNWDPNSPLYGKNPARPPADAASDAAATASADASAPAAAPAPELRASASAPRPAAGKADGAPAADALGDLAAARAAARAGQDPFNYFVQAGAFNTQGDADAQRAKLAMLGWQARVSEREQHGRAVYRVRVGPFDKRDDAEQFKEKLDGAGVDSTLVRVAR